MRSNHAHIPNLKSRTSNPSSNIPNTCEGNQNLKTNRMIKMLSKKKKKEKKKKKKKKKKRGRSMRWLMKSKLVNVW